MAYRRIGSDQADMCIRGQVGYRYCRSVDFRWLSGFRESMALA